MPNKYNELHRQAIYRIGRQHGFKITVAALREIQHAIDLPISKKHALTILREEMKKKTAQPKYQKRHETNLAESDEIGEIENTGEGVQSTPIEDNRSFRELHATYTKELLVRAEAEVKLIPTANLSRDLSRAIEQQKMLMGLDGVDTSILALIGPIVEECLANRSEPVAFFKQILALAQGCRRIDFEPVGLVESLVKRVRDHEVEISATQSTTPALVEREVIS
jgi:hypothetical protein